MTKQDPEGTKDIEEAIKSAINLCKSMAGRKRALKMIAYEFCEDSYSDGFQAGAQWQAERGCFNRSIFEDIANEVLSLGTCLTIRDGEGGIKMVKPEDYLVDFDPPNPPKGNT